MLSFGPPGRDRGRQRSDRGASYACRVIRGRLRRRGRGREDSSQDTVFEIDPGELSGVFAAPSWLRDLGIFAWLLVGIAAFLAGAVWLLSLVHTIVIPLLTAAIVAAVASPAVTWLHRRRLPRAVAAALVMLTLVALGALVLFAVLAGIANQSAHLGDQLSRASDKIAGWVQDLGVNQSTAQGAKSDASSSISAAAHTLLNGVAVGIGSLAALAVFLSFTIVGLFFMLKDGPALRDWADRHLGVPQAVARTITGRTIGSLRAYFVGVTAVSAFSAIIVGLGALVLGVPLPGTISLVTFVGGYVPYLGAWVAGAFAVLIALGGGGTDTAVAMGVVVLLANGALQQMFQPIAFGAALKLHPLAVLAVTIAGGALFGTIGLVLTAPLTSAAVRISEDLARARTESDAATTTVRSTVPG
jgi:predicted PurR-regulated permease PerM